MNFSVFVVILKPETNMKLGNQIKRCKKDSWESFHGRQIVWNTEYFKNPNSQHLLSKMCNAPKFSNRTIVMSSWESEIHTSVYITYCIYIYIITILYMIYIYIYINYIYITLHGLEKKTTKIRGAKIHNTNFTAPQHCSRFKAFLATIASPTSRQQKNGGGQGLRKVYIGPFLTRFFPVDYCQFIPFTMKSICTSLGLVNKHLCILKKILLYLICIIYHLSIHLFDLKVRWHGLQKGLARENITI